MNLLIMMAWFLLVETKETFSGTIELGILILCVVLFRREVDKSSFLSVTRSKCAPPAILFEVIDLIELVSESDHGIDLTWLQFNSPP